MLECVCESRGVLNLSLFKSWDKRRVHSKQEMMEHQSQALFLERNDETFTKVYTHNREPSAKLQYTNINLISSKLVNEISVHWYENWDISHPQYMNQVNIKVACALWSMTTTKSLTLWQSSISTKCIAQHIHDILLQNENHTQKHVKHALYS